MEGTAGKPSVGELIDLTLAGLRAHALPCGGAVLALVAINMLIDVTIGERGGSWAAGLISLAVQMIFMRLVLERDGLPNGDPRYGSLWGMSLLSNIAILVGLVLLVIPGLYLIARWFIAGPLIFAEDEGATTSLSRSWEMTEDSAWTIVGLFLLIIVPPMVGAMGVAAFAEVMGWWIDPQRALLANGFIYLCMSTAVVAIWVAEIAAYRALSGGGGHRTIGEVFV